MKKITLALLLIMVATAVFAAKAPVKKTEIIVKDPVIVKENVLVVEERTASLPQAYKPVSAIALTSNGYPLVRLPLGSVSLDLGLTANQPVAGHTHINFLVRSEQPLLKLTNSLQAYWAPELILFSDNGTMTITASLLSGAEYAFANNLSIFADLSLLSITSAGNATTWGILTNIGQVYTGIRMYL